MPVFDGPHVVAIAEVGNKKTDYDRSDVRQLTLLMNDVWRAILRKRTEEALLESKQQAELYVDLMGHDINNMNQIALGFLELALQRLDENKKLGEEDRFTIEKPIETLYNSAMLIHNVKKLQQARAGGLKVRSVDLDAMLSRCSQGIRPRAWQGRYYRLHARTGTLRDGQRPPQGRLC